jgi:hypothetical protein
MSKITETNMPFTTAEAIAREHLGIETLRERKSDRLDFHDCGVLSIRAALVAAYEAGRSNGRINGRAKLLTAAKQALRDAEMNEGHEVLYSTTLTLRSAIEAAKE